MTTTKPYKTLMCSHRWKGLTSPGSLSGQFSFTCAALYQRGICCRRCAHLSVWHKPVSYQNGST